MPVPSRPPDTNTHSWSLWQAGLTFSTLQGGHRRRTSRHPALTTRSCGATRARLPPSPLAAGAGDQAKSTNRPRTHLQNGRWEQQAPTPALRTVLTAPFSAQLTSLWIDTNAGASPCKSKRWIKPGAQAQLLLRYLKLFPWTWKQDWVQRFERAVKESSGREICQSTLMPFYWNQRGIGILIPITPSIPYVKS